MLSYWIRQHKSNLYALQEELKGKSKLGALHEEPKGKSKLGALHGELEDKSKLCALHEEPKGKLIIWKSFMWVLLPKEELCWFCIL